MHLCLQEKGSVRFSGLQKSRRPQRTFEGSFDKDKLQLARINTNPSKGNLNWNFPYMSLYMKVWMSAANQRHGDGTDKEQCKIGSEELHEVIELCARHAVDCHMPLLEAILHTKAGLRDRLKPNSFSSLLLPSIR